MIKTMQYKKYGKCAVLENDGMKALVTLDVGPRIIYLSPQKEGWESNLFFEDLGDEINKQGSFFDEHFGGDAWHIYGGHRLWKSPEDLASYYPDNSPCQMIEKEGEVLFTREKECTTGLVKEIGIKFIGKDTMQVRHAFINKGAKSMEVSLWGLSVMAAGGTLVLPLSKIDTDLLPNRNIVFWPYTDMRDERLSIENDKIVLRQKDTVKKPLKIGTCTGRGVAVYFHQNGALKKEYSTDKLGYPDYACSMELYTNHLMLEMETLSPVTLLKQGEKMESTEYWTLAESGSATFENWKKEFES